MILSSHALLPTAALLVLSAVISQTEAFGLVNTSIKPFSTSSPSFAVIRPTRHSSALCAEGGEASKEEAEEEKEQVVTDESTDEDASTTDEKEEAPAVAKEDEVDPEVKALKDEISKLESDLKQKNRDLSKLQDIAEDYSEGGYARKVAEMEGYRRTRSAASKDSGMVARASVLQSFLPIVDALKSNADVYADDEFAKKYSALGSDFNNALKNLGVAEYSVEEGENINTLRTTTVKEEYSDTIAKGCVISSVRDGFELKGNVMRMAEVVVSLGSEAEAKAVEEAKAAQEVDDKDGEESEELEEKTAAEGED